MTEISLGSLREIKTLCAFEMCTSLCMPNIHNMQAPCCRLLSSMCALTSQEVCMFEGSAPLLSFPSLPQDAAGEKKAGDMANAKGLGRASIHLSLLRYA